MRAARPAGLALAFVFLGIAVLASVGVGAVDLSPRTILGALVHRDPARAEHVIVWTVRVPRTIVGLLVGVALGVSGAVMQATTRNALADPGLLGVNAGAALFVAIGIHALGVTSLRGWLWSAFLGAACVSVLVHLLGSSEADRSPVRLVLAGAAISVLCASVTRLVLLADLATLDQFRFWEVGSLIGRGPEVAWMIAPFVVLGAALALGLAGALDALALGDDAARSLGTHVGRTRAVAGLAVVLLCGSATAAAGPIAFVGLAVPHLARRVTGPSHRWLMGYSAVIAPVLLLTADVLGRVVAPPGELEVGIVTAFLGGPLLVALVRRGRPVAP